MTSPIDRILIVDDSTFFHEYLSAICVKAGLHVVGCAALPADALEMARDLEPDVVLMDLMLGRTRSGLEVAVEMVDAGSPARMILFSDSEPAAVIRYAADHGVDSYLTKNLSPNRLMTALKQVSSGACLWTTGAAPYMRADWDARLSPRDWRELGHVARGHTDEEIAVLTREAVETCRKRRNEVERLLGLKGAALYKFAMVNGFDLVPVTESPR